MTWISRFILLSFALLLAACGKEPLYQEQAYVFGTQVDVTIYGEDEAKARLAVTSVLQEFQRLHDMLHAWKPSELSELNAAIAKGKSKQVSTELAAMLKDAARVSAQSDGLFNPAIGNLIQAWGFQADDFKAVLPNPKAITGFVKSNPKMSDLGFIERHSSKSAVSVLSRNRTVRLDLGGYAKGYALDRAALLLKQKGIHNALINIGGNVMALGKRGARAWRIGIQHPRKLGPLAILELQDGEAIGTSGDYQRYFELGGKRYCHLIDPRTGYPVQGVQAVTILTHGKDAGLQSDALSKPLFISGNTGWLAAAQKMKLDEALLIDAQGMVHLTASMRKRLKFTDETTKRMIAP